MANIKRLLAVVMAAILMICVLSPCASAANIIDRIDIKLNTNIAGMTAYDYQKIYTVQTKDVGYLDYFEGDNGIEIYENGKSIGFKELQGGKTYSFILNLRVYKSLKSDVAVYVNGQQIAKDKIKIRTSVDPKGDSCKIIKVTVQNVKVDQLNFFARMIKSISDFFASITSFFKNLFN